MERLQYFVNGRNKFAVGRDAARDLERLHDYLIAADGTAAFVPAKARWDAGTLMRNFAERLRLTDGKSTRDAFALFALDHPKIATIARATVLNPAEEAERFSHVIEWTDTGETP
jgi:hypothetical protein